MVAACLGEACLSFVFVRFLGGWAASSSSVSASVSVSVCVCAKAALACSFLSFLSFLSLLLLSFSSLERTGAKFSLCMLRHNNPQPYPVNRDKHLAALATTFSCGACKKSFKTGINCCAFNLDDAYFGKERSES